MQVRTLGRLLLLALATFLLAIFLADSVFATASPKDISAPSGYKVEIIADKLAAPSMLAFDSQGRLLVVETGLGGSGEAKVTRIAPDGQRQSLVKQEAIEDGLAPSALAIYQDQIYLAHGGSVSIINQDGTLSSIIQGLPAEGDYFINKLLFHQDQLFLAIGTVTNSGVVGPDNAILGWLKDPENRLVHDIPCQDIFLTNQTFGQPATSPFAEHGVDGVKELLGTPFCNGAVLKANPDGSELEVYAWGFRNPVGLEMGSDNKLYLSMQGFEERGSRPVKNAPDCFYLVMEGSWYGWPDFACDEPVEEPVLRQRPTEFPPKPVAKFDPKLMIGGFDFMIDQWGKPSEVLVAVAPNLSGQADILAAKIVKLDVQTGKVEDLIQNKGQSGFKHPVTTSFGPDGALYVVDWGAVSLTSEGLKIAPDSGVIWKVTKLKPSPLGQLWQWLLELWPF